MTDPYDTYEICGKYKMIERSNDDNENEFKICGKYKLVEIPIIPDSIPTEELFPSDDPTPMHQLISSVDKLVNDSDYLKIYYGLNYADKVKIQDTSKDVLRSIFQLKKNVYPGSLTGKLFRGDKSISFYGNCNGNIEFVSQFSDMDCVGHINYENGKMVLGWTGLGEFFAEEYIIASYEYDRE